MKRYLTWKEAKEYTGMGDVELEELLRIGGVKVLQLAGPGGRRIIDSADIDVAFKNAKGWRTWRR